MRVNAMGVVKPTEAGANRGARRSAKDKMQITLNLYYNHLHQHANWGEKFRKISTPGVNCSKGLSPSLSGFAFTSDVASYQRGGGRIAPSPSEASGGADPPA